MDLPDDVLGLVFRAVGTQGGWPAGLDARRCVLPLVCTGWRAVVAASPPDWWTWVRLWESSGRAAQAVCAAPGLQAPARDDVINMSSRHARTSRAPPAVDLQVAVRDADLFPGGSPSPRDFHAACGRFMAWLEPRAGHVRRLDFELRSTPAAVRPEALAELLAGAVRRCGAALESLRLMPAGSPPAGCLVWASLAAGSGAQLLCAAPGGRCQSARTRPEQSVHMRRH